MSNLGFDWTKMFLMIGFRFGEQLGLDIHAHLNVQSHLLSVWSMCCQCVWMMGSQLTFSPLHLYIFALKWWNQIIHTNLWLQKLTVSLCYLHSSDLHNMEQVNKKCCCSVCEWNRQGTGCCWLWSDRWIFPSFILWYRLMVMTLTASTNPILKI